MVCATSRKKAVHHLKVSAAQATPWAASSAAFTSPATMAHSSAFSAHPCLCASTAALPRKMQTRLPQWLQRQLKKSKLKNFIYSKKAALRAAFLFLLEPSQAHAFQVSTNWQNCLTCDLKNVYMMKRKMSNRTKRENTTCLCAQKRAHPVVCQCVVFKQSRIVALPGRRCHPNALNQAKKEGL